MKFFTFTYILVTWSYVAIDCNNHSNSFYLMKTWSVCKIIVSSKDGLRPSCSPTCVVSVSTNLNWNKITTVKLKFNQNHFEYIFFKFTLLKNFYLAHNTFYNSITSYSLPQNLIWLWNPTALSLGKLQLKHLNGILRSFFFANHNRLTTSLGSSISC